MAISAVAVARTIGSWLTREETTERVEIKPAPEKEDNTWLGLDNQDHDLRRVQRGLDLMTIKSFNRH